jgi:hypothetical protein
MRRRDLELSLRRGAVVAGDEDDEEDEAGLGDRSDPVETIRYFPMARLVLMSLAFRYLTSRS